VTVEYVAFPPVGDKDGRFKDHQFLIRLVTILPECLYPARAFLVLVLFLCKRSQWQLMQAEVSGLIKECFRNGMIHHRVVRKLQKLSVALFIVTFALHLIWLGSEWNIWNIYDGVKVHFSNNTLWTSDCYLHYFSFCISMAQYSSITMPLVEIPFILSQQVLMSIIILAMGISETLRILHENIQAETLHHTRMQCTDFAGSLPTDCWTSLQQKIKLWTHIYTGVLELSHKFNDCSGWILFVTVGCDTLAALGFGANIVRPQSADFQLPSLVCLYFVTSCMIFLSYATVFVLPLVYLHEKVNETM
jgi:hypothetical protein